MNVVKIAKMAFAAAVVAANLGMVAPDRAMAQAGTYYVDSFSFGVEREMKESGEKGGPQASTAQDAAAGDKIVLEDDNPEDRRGE